MADFVAQSAFTDQETLTITLLPDGSDGSVTERVSQFSQSMATDKNGFTEFPGSQSHSDVMQGLYFGEQAIDVDGNESMEVYLLVNCSSVASIQMGTALTLSGFAQQATGNDLNLKVEWLPLNAKPVYDQA